MTNARLIHVGNTRAGRKLFFRLDKERQKLLSAGFDPTPKLLAAKLDVDEADLIEVSSHLASREVSLEPRPDDEGGSLAERISRHEPSPEDQAARSELAKAQGEMGKLRAELAGQKALLKNADETEINTVELQMLVSNDPVENAPELPNSPANPAEVHWPAPPTLTASTLPGATERVADEL